MKDQERFARALLSVARGVSKLQVSEICCGGLTREQFETLRRIEAAGNPSMGSLAASLGVELSTMSRNVSVLERERYVSRGRTAGDSRIVTVALSPRGREALQTLRCDEQDVMDRVYARVPAPSRLSIIAALEGLRAALGSDGVASGTCCTDNTAPKRAAR